MLEHVARHEPEFLILQCGADSIAGDPLTNLRFTPAVHAQAARDLCALADRLGHGRLLALGGGGYDRGNLARPGRRGGGAAGTVSGANKGLRTLPGTIPLLLTLQDP
jgi:hypothetical protein